MRLDPDDGAVLTSSSGVRTTDSTLRARPDSAALAVGLPGVALLLAEEAQTRSDDDVMALARQTLQQAVAATAAAPLTTPGLLDGSSGLSLVTDRFAALDDRYAATARRMHDRVLDQILATDWNYGANARAARDYDVVSGAAGALLYLCSVDDGSTTQRIAAAHVIDFLTWLLDGEDLARAAITTVGDETTLYGRFYPQGLVDLGAAHGVAGVVRALALAARHHDVDRDVLARSADRLAAIGVDGRWPRALPLGAPEGSPPETAGWCYGSVGVAHALLAAATTLGDVAAAAASRQRCRELADAERCADPTLCHGRAGLLLVALEVGADDGAVERLRSSLRTGLEADGEGFLEGGAGVDLALLESGRPSGMTAWRTALFAA